MASQRISRLKDVEPLRIRSTGFCNAVGSLRCIMGPGAQQVQQGNPKGFLADLSDIYCDRVTTSHKAPKAGHLHTNQCSHMLLQLLTVWPGLVMISTANIIMQSAYVFVLSPLFEVSSRNAVKLLKLIFEVLYLVTKVCLQIKTLPGIFNNTA